MSYPNTKLHSHAPSHANFIEGLGSLGLGAAFFELWLWLLPKWLEFQVSAGRWRWIAAIPSILGFAVALHCVRDFAQSGRGTPAPFAPPKKLVVVGFYRYVRNPMYLGFFSGWIGLWIVLGRASFAAIALAAAVIVGTIAFVHWYEEPHLRGIFGAPYLEYCRHVPGWLPRLRGWPV